MLNKELICNLYLEGLIWTKETGIETIQLEWSKAYHNAKILICFNYETQNSYESSSIGDMIRKDLKSVWCIIAAYIYILF